MGKLCRYCGSEITDGVKFCPNCGKETGESNGSQYTKGPYNQEWIHVGKEEDDHRSIDETITAVPFGITMKYEGK